MAQKPLDPQGGEAATISARTPGEQAAWFDRLVERLGGTKSDTLRRVLDVARKHEEELLETS